MKLDKLHNSHKVREKKGVIRVASIFIPTYFVVGCTRRHKLSWVNMNCTGYGKRTIKNMFFNLGI